MFFNRVFLSRCEYSIFTLEKFSKSFTVWCLNGDLEYIYTYLIITFEFPLFLQIHYTHFLKLTTQFITEKYRKSFVRYIFLVNLNVYIDYA